MNFCKRSLVFIFLLACGFGVLKLEAAVDPVVVELHYQNGVKYYKRGLYEKAIQEFDKVLSLDPENKEAAEYREKVKSFSEKKQLVDARSSRDEVIQKLTKEGKSRYGKRDYLGAIETFNQVLELKPIDDVASEYKEKCEAAIGKGLTHDRKIEEKKKQKERAKEARLAKIEEKNAKEFARKKMLADRSRINEERRQAREEKARALKAPKEEVKVEIEEELGEEIKEEAGGTTEAIEEAIEETVVVSQEAEAPAKEAQDKREARLQEKQQKRQEALDLRRQRLAEARERKEEKAEAAREARRKKLAAKKERAQEKKDAREVSQEEARNVKALYLEGVENFGRHQFEAAVNLFEAVIDAEKAAKKKVYTTSAQRFKDRAQKRLDNPEPVKEAKESKGFSL